MQEQFIDKPTYLILLIIHISINKNFYDDTENQFLYGVREVDLGGRVPLLQHFPGVLNGKICVAIYTTLVKSRHHEAALLVVKIAVAGEQAIPEQSFQAPGHFVGEVAC